MIWPAMSIIQEKGQIQQHMNIRISIFNNTIKTIYFIYYGLFRVMCQYTPFDHYSNHLVNTLTNFNKHYTDV